jgi:AbrB family looped-hinge helix DNA binding protein
MAEIDVTTISSKGQIVIPSEMRAGFKEGDKLVVIKSGGQLILKSAKDFDENIKEDIAFAKRTEEALKRYEGGKFKEVAGEDFLKSLDRW